MYGCESCTIKKAEHWKIDAFELWCWRRLLKVLWTARRSNQSILKDISSGCSLQGLMMKLKLQYFGHLCQELAHWKRPWCWEWLEAGGEGDNRGWHGWMASVTWWTWVWASSESWWWTGKTGMLWSIGSQRVRHDWAAELNCNLCGSFSGPAAQQASLCGICFFHGPTLQISTKCQGLIPGFTLEHEKFLKHKLVV